MSYETGRVAKLVEALKDGKADERRAAAMALEEAGLEAGAAVPALAKALTDRIRSQQNDLEVLRHEHAKLQQAVYEAAQVQRRLCSPRELVCGEFEIAGEIFPVRHLSGDFFKVMQLDGVLGLVLGDIAGKGLSAGIWQAHLMDLIQRCSQTHLHPTDAVAAVNRELCLNQNEPPITALRIAACAAASIKPC